jgi:hypothetical protein
VKEAAWFGAPALDLRHRLAAERSGKTMTAERHSPRTVYREASRSLLEDRE